MLGALALTTILFKAIGNLLVEFVMLFDMCCTLLMPTVAAELGGYRAANASQQQLRQQTATTKSQEQEGTPQQCDPDLCQIWHSLHCHKAEVIL